MFVCMGKSKSYNRTLNARRRRVCSALMLGPERERGAPRGRDGPRGPPRRC